MSDKKPNATKAIRIIVVDDWTEVKEQTDE